MKHIFCQRRWRVYSLRRFRLLIACSAAIIAVAALCGSFGAVLWVSADNAPSVPYPLQTAPPYTVAIDAGHGHFDTGAKGVIQELALCEGSADALYSLLAADARFAPVRTRQAGEAPKISERAKTAADAHASVLLSLHGNSDSARSTHGFECYPTPPGRLYSAESMRLAQCIAEGMGAEGHHLRGGGVGIRYAYYYGKEKRMVDIVDDKIRTQKSFGILERSLCPAVLVEQCFISNAADVSEWAGKLGYERAARVYYKALCSYFGISAL